MRWINGDPGRYFSAVLLPLLLLLLLRLLLHFTPFAVRRHLVKSFTTTRGREVLGAVMGGGPGGPFVFFLCHPVEYFRGYASTTTLGAPKVDLKLCM